VLDPARQIEARMVGNQHDAATARTFGPLRTQTWSGLGSGTQLCQQRLVCPFGRHRRCLLSTHARIRPLVTDARMFEWHDRDDCMKLLWRDGSLVCRTSATNAAAPELRGVQ